MFLNVSTNIFMQLPLDKSLTVISEMGFKNIEISARHLNKLCKDKESFSSIIKIKKIDVYSVHSYLNDLTRRDFTSVYKEIYHNLFSVAKTLGASVFVTHIGEGKFEEWNKIKERTFYHCQLLADLAREYNLIVGLENDWGGGGPLRKSNQFEELIKAVDRDNFGITLDGKHSMPSHQYPLEYQANGPEEFIEKLSKYIVNFHSAELDGPVPWLADWDVPGTGTGRLGKTITMLRDSGYEGPITIELQSEIIQKVLEVTIQILFKDSEKSRNFSDLLKDKYFIGRKMLEASKEYFDNLYNTPKNWSGR